MKIKRRSWNDSDKDFIFSTLKKQLYRSKVNDYRFMEKQDYETTMNDFLESKLSEFDIDIFCPVEADFQILGYIIYNSLKDIVVYAYVKSIYRGNGIFSFMIDKVFDGIPVYYCFRTDNKIWKNYTKKYALKYLPIELTKGET